MQSQLQIPKKKNSHLSSCQVDKKRTRRRARVACKSCRARKQRCNVENGIPCSTCVLDNEYCHVIQPKKRKVKCQDELSAKGFTQGRLSFALDAAEDGSLGVGTGTRWPKEKDSYPESNREFVLPNEVLLWPRSPIGAPESVAQATKHAFTKNSSTARAPSKYEPSWLHLPHFTQTVSSKAKLMELEYLNHRGAFTLPQQRFRNELLRCYVDHVHPFLPILNLRSFLQAIWKNDSTDQVSLLLFRAVMFAATAFVDISHLRTQGYDSRRAARRAFFQHVKLLYDFGMETDRTSLLQATLLMTYWYESPDDLHDAWYWLGEAIMWAKSLGVHCSQGERPPDTPTAKLWRRLWWSCHVRDRIITLGLRRPMHIGPGDIDASPLTLEDFDLRPLPKQVWAIVNFTPTIGSEATMTKLAKMAIEFGNLCCCIGEILGMQFWQSPVNPNSDREAKKLQLKPKYFTLNSEIILKSNEKLETWFHNIAEELQYFGPGSHDVIMGTDDPPSVLLHRASLMCMYFTANITLHRSQFHRSQLDAIQQSTLQALSSLKVRVAANEVVRIYQDLASRSLIQYLPHAGVTCLIPAALIHLADSKTCDLTARNISIQKAKFCLDTLQMLRQTYASADYAVVNLFAAKDKIDASFVPIVSNQGLEPELSQDMLMNSLLDSLTMSEEERNALSNWMQSSDDFPVGIQQSRRVNTVSTVTSLEMTITDSLQDECDNNGSLSPSQHILTPNEVNHIRQPKSRALTEGSIYMNYDSKQSPLMHDAPSDTHTVSLNASYTAKQRSSVVDFEQDGGRPTAFVISTRELDDVGLDFELLDATDFPTCPLDYADMNWACS